MQETIRVADWKDLGPAGIGGAVGWALTFLHGMWRERRRDRREEVQQTAQTALAQEDQKLREIHELFEAQEKNRDWIERLQGALEKTQMALGEVWQKVRECEERDAAKALALQALTVTYEQTLARLTDLHEKHETLLARTTELEGEQKSLRREHWDMEKRNLKVEEMVEKLETGGQAPQSSGFE